MVMTNKSIQSILIYIMFISGNQDRVAIFHKDTHNRQRIAHLLKRECISYQRSNILELAKLTSYPQTWPIRSLRCRRLSYHGYAMREVTLNSTSLYETNKFSIKGFSCLFSHHSPIYWFLPEEAKCVFPTYLYKNKWISEFHRKKNTRNWNVDLVSALITSWDIT